MTLRCLTYILTPFHFPFYRAWGRWYVPHKRAQGEFLSCDWIMVGAVAMLGGASFCNMFGGKGFEHIFGVIFHLLRFFTMSALYAREDQIQGGLLKQKKNFFQKHPETRLCGLQVNEVGGKKRFGETFNVRRGRQRCSVSGMSPFSRLQQQALDMCR